MQHIKIFMVTAVIILLSGMLSIVHAQLLSLDGDHAKPHAKEQTLPKPLYALLQTKKQNTGTAEDKGLPFDIRAESMKEAAISYGARGGLSWQTYHIRLQMDRRAAYMDKVFDFRRLLVPAPSGLMIEPPIVSESENNMIIETDGQQAAVNDRMYNIMMNARIVSAPRLWRNYLEREWDAVEPPPDILLPETKEDREKWEEFVRIGWDQGVEQANEIFQEDLNLMLSDFRGMVRYRKLLAQGMISPPYALQVDRGVTGGGDQMRIGDRAIQITGKPELIPGFDQWQPANR
jgi:defect-in-organelle-trafficking protein DotC